jgi:hypothetical protein
VPIVLKSGSLDLLEPCGPVQACNGTALPFFFTFSVTVFARGHAVHFKLRVLALVIPYANRIASLLRRITLQSVVCLAVPYFSTVSYERHDFRERDY